MSRFKDDNVRPEEEFGGFEPEGEADETFKLERLEGYPGDLDKYVPAKRPIGFVSHDAQEIPKQVEPTPVPEVRSEPEIAPIAPIAAEQFQATNAKNTTVATAEKEEKNSWFPWLAAAVVLFALIGGWWYSNNNANTPNIAEKKEPMHVTTENNVAPEIVIDSAAAQAELLKNDSALAENASAADSLKTGLEDFKNSNTIASNTPDTDLARNMTVEETKPTITENVKKANEPVLKRAANGLYVVQIYSSPSRDDADEWLGRLRSRSVENPVITSQKIRGQDWYRVRFGSYSTKEEAERAALKLGFAQSWIVQVR